MAARNINKIIHKIEKIDISKKRKTKEEYSIELTQLIEKYRKNSKDENYNKFVGDLVKGLARNCNPFFLVQLSNDLKRIAASKWKDEDL